MVAYFLLSDIIESIHNWSATELATLNFEYCQHMNGSKFELLKGYRLNVQNEIDSKAIDLFHLAKNENPELRNDSLLRLSCYTATMPEENEYLSYTTKLVSLPDSYFPMLPFSENSENVINSYRTSTCKRDFKIVYFFIIHHHISNLKVFP